MCRTAVFPHSLLENQVTIPPRRKKKDAAERIENLSVTELTLITAYNGTESLELSEWIGDFNKRSAGILKEFYEVLMMYGFTYNSDDEVKLLNGTHELYTETEIE